MPTISQINQLDPGPEIDVPEVVDEEQINSFIEQGYLVVPDLVSTSEVDEICGDMVELARGTYPCDSLKSLSQDTSPEAVLQQILCIHQPHYVSPVIEKYVRHPQICGVLSQITAAHLPFWDGSVMCMQSMMFVKPPGFQGQAWHQDEVYIPTRDRSLVGAWIALDDATIDNGCLYILPESHREGLLFPQREHGNPDEFDFAPQSYGFDDSTEIPVEVKRGSVVFFNGYLLHRSPKNRSDIYRRALVSHYCNAWSRLPWQEEGDEPPATSHYRNCIHVAGIDPYNWMGNKPTENKVWLRTCKANEENG